MDPNDHYYLDRRYNNNRGRFGQKGYRSQRFNRPQGRYGHNHPCNKKCFVCNKEGCIYFNNLTDTIVGRTTLPVIRKWGHPWFLLPKTNEAAIAFLTESEIRTLHRRFGYLENISRFCHHCQMHSQAPRRFKFTLKDDQEFNYEIVADVLYLGTPQRPVLHVDTWEALRALWIDTYLGPPDTIKHDAGTNFASLEFRNEVERYHAPLRPINDTTGPNGIKAMKMLRQLSAEREVRVWREKLGWQGPFKISAIDGSNVTIDTINGPQTFRSTLVQPYFRDETTIPAPLLLRIILTFLFLILRAILFLFLPAPAPVPAPNPRRRASEAAPGSKNKPKTTFLVKKEEDAYQLAIKLRDEGIITTPGTL
ncbi:transposase [Hirsutella rhossiliensis]|uniref:Transposase n=1 Tax=Hirsutella rhossiliensis TaxID=111463 RepID=A0A9P8MS00_9HYPO|nr:transposase [Hirsutella rhossiliensis]KAH0959399.1 transposase [Hirsutella rhossiliensis]